MDKVCEGVVSFSELINLVILVYISITCVLYLFMYMLHVHRHYNNCRFQAVVKLGRIRNQAPLI